MRALGLLLAMGFIFLTALPALEVYLAPLVYQDETREGGGKSRIHPDSDVLEAMSEIRAGEKLFIMKARDGGGDPPRSLLDAARLCEAQSYQHLLYGYVKRTAFAYHAEIKLYDGDSRDVVAVFFASDDGQHYERLVADVASKILSHFYGPVGVGTGANEPEPEKNRLRVPCGLGYWTPSGGHWNDIMTGLVAVVGGIRFIPSRPAFRIGRYRGYGTLGVEVEYALGMGEPGYESFFLHSVRIRSPGEVHLDLTGGHSVGLGLGPLLEIDIASQDRKYDDVFVETTVVAGVGAALIYRYQVSERTAIGLAANLDVAAYDDPLVSFSPRLYADFTLGRRPEAAFKEGGAQ